MKKFPKIKIVSEKGSTHIYQDDQEIKLVTGFSVSQVEAGKLPILYLEIIAADIEVEADECEIGEEKPVEELEEVIPAVDAE